MDEVAFAKNILLDKMCINCKWYFTKACKITKKHVDELGTCDSWEEQDYDTEYQKFVDDLAKATGVPRGYFSAKYQS